MIVVQHDKGSSGLIDYSLSLGRLGLFALPPEANRSL